MELERWLFFSAGTKGSSHQAETWVVLLALYLDMLSFRCSFQDSWFYKVSAVLYFKASSSLWSMLHFRAREVENGTPEEKALTPFFLGSGSLPECL